MVKIFSFLFCGISFMRDLYRDTRLHSRKTRQIIPKGLKEIQRF